MSVENLKFSKWNVFIGPNNAGKTNLIRALSFLAEMTKNGKEEGTTALYQQLSKRGWDRMLRFGASNPHVTFSWEFITSERPEALKYDLSIHVGKSASERREFFITNESLGFAKSKRSDKDDAYRYYSCHSHTPERGYFSIVPDRDTPNKQRSSIPISVRSNETAFLQMDELRDNSEQFDNIYRNVYADGMKMLSRYLRDYYSYASADFELSKVRKPVKAADGVLSLSSDGSNLVNVISNWSSNDYPTFNRYKEMLWPLFNATSPIDLRIDHISGTGEIRLLIGMGNQNYYLDDLSDGSIKLMLLAALLVNRERPMSVCAIDEPEMNLHPEWQGFFCDWLARSNASQQFFISTHSPEILDALTPSFKNDELKIFVISDKSDVVELTNERVQSYLDSGFNIGDLYRAKAPEIDGWPK